MYKDKNLYVHTIGLIDYKINNKETNYSDIGSLSDTAQTLSSNPEITRLDINAFDGNLIKNKESFLNLPLCNYHQNLLLMKNVKLTPMKLTTLTIHTLE